MALDIGEKTIGVAVSGGGIALPLETLRRGALAGDCEKIRLMATERGIGTVLVGWPLDIAGGGAETPALRRSRVFMEALREALSGTGLAVEAWDERFSTAEARSALAGGGASASRMERAVDASAAAVILQSWLDSHPVQSHA